MALRRVKMNIDRVLDKNMQDLVRGIRNHKEGEAKYISECLDEIKQELRSGDLQAKSNAVAKLLYLQMIGYEISWAAFNVIEVMSSTKFTHKRLGYLTASQSFHVDTDVLMLATNMIRKDLCSAQMYDAGVALSGLSCFISPDLAQDLANDIMSLMMSTRPYMRKKAILLMYKVYLNYPDALRPSFPRLKEKLEDPDPGVQCAAVNVICELARKNPKNYLSLAPTFFKLMTNSSNNWMLIKIIKLFGALTPLEPRLGKKLIEPLTNLIHSTSAMSLLYECINTVIAVLVSISTDLPNHSTSVQLCVQKLRVLIEDSDQNLKYLGLLAFSKILKTHPKSVQAHKDLVLQCLDDRDESIRMRALDLLYGMVSKKNLMEIVRKLMVHMDKAEGTAYRDELMCKVIEICTQNNYQHVVNFEWYLSVLVELTKMKSTQHGKLLSNQMMDVAIRVEAIRKFAVGQMAILLENSPVFAHNSQGKGICEILFAAAWLCGEYASLLANPMNTLEAMFIPKVTSLPGHIQSVYVQNIMKLYSAILVKAEVEGDDAKIREVSQVLLNKLPMYVQSSDLEVQERACSALQLMKYIIKLLDKGVSVGEEVAFLFTGELNPVAPKAQKKVPVPEGLDLDQWINKPPAKPVEMKNKASIFSTSKDQGGASGDSEKRRKAKELTEEEMKAQREARLEAQANNPHYLKLLSSPKIKAEVAEEAINVVDIPVETLDLNIDIEISKGIDGLARADRYYQESLAAEKEKKRQKRKKGKKGKRRKGADDSDEDSKPAQQVKSVFEMPEGATAGDSDNDDEGKDDVIKRLDINLDEPLRDDEKLPVRQHRVDGAHALPEPVDGTSKAADQHEKKKKKKKDKEGAGSKKSSKKSKKKSLSDELAEAGIIDTPAKSAVDLLSPPAVSVSAPLTNGVEAVPTPSKKEKSRKKPKSSKHRKDKSLYEVAEGVTTPSKEHLSGTATPTNVMDLGSLNLTNYRTLATDANLSLEFEPRVSLQQPNTLVVAVVFSNQSTSHSLKSLDFNVLDSMNAKLTRQTQDEAVKVPFDLMPLQRNEAQFIFTVKSLSMAQKVKGTVTYILKDEQGSSQQKLDFRLVVPCRDFLVSVPCTADSLSQLLSSDEQLTAKYSKRFPTDSDFKTVLMKLCFYAHAYIVEQMDMAASLYASSIQGHHICFLVKLQGGHISIDGKSSDSNFISSILDEVVELLQK
ncbi:AP-3 complex subunit delta-1-like [Watersipora subatra]|uniref:AP-3 complex subunit delta-1-like n=1 Tax=Watersipora subatra TaxID=2589382 RepID=UPI00355BED36